MTNTSEQVKTWETKDHQEIPINELTDSHIQNILTLFNGSEVDYERGDQLDAVIEEARGRGIDTPCEFECDIDDYIMLMGDMPS